MATRHLMVLYAAIIAGVAPPIALYGRELAPPDRLAETTIGSAEPANGMPQWSMFKKGDKRTGRTNTVGPQENRLRWEHLLSRGLGIQSPQAIGADGTVYTGSYTGTFYAFAPDGSRKWKRRLGAHQITAGPAIGKDGTIYIPSESGMLYALSSSGEVEWTFDLGGYSGPSASPAIGGDGVIYVGATKFHAINPDGTLKWRYDTGAYINGPPAIGSDGTIYFPSSTYLYALNPDGTLKWRSKGKAAYPPGSAPAIGKDGTIYVNTHDGVLHAFQPDGTLAWTYSTSGIVMDVPSSPAIGADGTVYFGGAGEYNGRGGYFYALDPAGNLKWKYFAGCDQTAPSVGGDGTIYFGNNDCYSILALNSDGTLKWSYSKGVGAYMRSAPAIGRNGRMYSAFLVDPAYLPQGGLLAFGSAKQ